MLLQSNLLNPSQELPAEEPVLQAEPTSHLKIAFEEQHILQKPPALEIVLVQESEQLMYLN